MVCLLAILSTVSIRAQESGFASPEHYLVDSLLLDSLTTADKRILDTLLPAYHQQMTDSGRLHILNTIIENCWGQDVWPRYNQYLLRYVASKLEDNPNHPLFLKYRATGLNNLGYFYDTQGDAVGAMEQYKTSLVIMRQLNDSTGIATALNNLGYIYKVRGEIAKALDCYEESLRILEAQNDRQKVSSLLVNLGTIYLNQEEPEKSLEYYKKALEVKEEMGDTRSISSILHNMGNVYTSLGDLDKTLECYERGYKLAQQTEEKYQISHLLMGMGITKRLQGKEEEAYGFFERSLKLREETNDKLGICRSLTAIGEILLKRKQYARAKKDGRRALQLAQEMGYPREIRNAADLISNIADAEGDYKTALDMHRLSAEMKDSIYNTNTQKASIRQQMKYEFEKKEALMQAEKEKQELAHREEAKRQQLVIWSVVAGLVLVIIFSIFLFNRFRVTQRQKNVITQQKLLVDQKNRHITDSINYAQKIQAAILPSRESFHKAFGRNGTAESHHFILYKPKDVVSGDFYWLYETPDDKVIWAAADCTGHGVPGAFMSMIGNSLLNEIVIEKGQQQSHEILEQLREGIKKAFDQENITGKEIFNGKKEIRRDGMDIALCVLNKSNKQLQFSGAYNHLYLIRNGELLVTEANRQPIGVYRKEHPFEQNLLQLEKGDMLYTFSDGYADQFGGPEARKFSTRKFRELLITIHQEPMSGQKAILEDTINAWQQGREQVDDICVIGVRV